MNRSQTQAGPAVACPNPNTNPASLRLSWATAAVRMLLLLALGAATTISAATPKWPQFRGYNASGISDFARPPIHFGPDTNLLWKVPVPAGVSSPIVWENHLFLTAVADHQLVTLAFDIRNGRELWRQAAPAVKLEPCHSFSSPAASTPCTDGRRVYAYFGSYGLLAYDFDGKEVWRHAFDRSPSQYGTATSPILAGNQLILQRDGDSTNSQLVALAPATGKILWETPRPLAGACYSTPMVWRHDGIEELMIQGKGRITAYNLKDGQPKWWVRGWGFSAVTTPVAGDGILFVGGSGMGDPSGPPDPLFDWSKLLAEYDANHDGNLAITEVPASVVWHIRKEIPLDVPGNGFPMRGLLSAFVDTDRDGIVTHTEWDASEAFSKDKFNADRFVAIRPGGQDDSTDTHVLWESTKGLSEMPSPLYYRGRLHFLRDGGLWTVLEPKTGKRILDRERLGIGGQMIGSPIAADGYIFTVNESGTFAVVQAGDTLKVIAVNKLGENVRCTPAIDGNTIYVRTTKNLWAFGSR